jgi:ABC-type uncharacterized transport system permease subunit
MDILTDERFLTTLVLGILAAGIPLTLAAMGETFAQRSGVFNIGLEGMVLMGAYAGFVGAYYSGSEWIGFAAGAGVGMFMSLFMIVLHIRMGLDLIVIGIALVLSSEGITSLLHGAQFGTTYPRLGSVPRVEIPFLSNLPVLGNSLFTQHVIVYITFALLGVTWYVLRKTKLGLNLRASGDRPEALDKAGVSVIATRAWAELITGCLAGIGGAYLSIVSAGVFVPFMSNGTGFIAVMICMLSAGRPLILVSAAMLFGGALSLVTALQVVGVNIPTDLVQMLPFVAVIIALLTFAGRASLPASFGKPYVRGAR